MTDKDKEAGRREGQVDTRLDVLEKYMDELKAELKSARAWVWKMGATMIGVLVAQWLKLLGIWGGS